MLEKNNRHLVVITNELNLLQKVFWYFVTEPLLIVHNSSNLDCSMDTFVSNQMSLCVTCFELFHPLADRSFEKATKSDVKF